MKIIGYAEDSLTLWALSNKLDQILAKLRDNTAKSDCVVFYRPSFGRKGGNRSSEFGEFDAIIGTHKYTYLIESKWDGLKNLPEYIVKLSDVQIRRHIVFSWYFQEWRKVKSNDWREFSESIRGEFTKHFSGKPVPQANTILANNLSFILNKLTPFSGKTKNILFFFHRSIAKPRVLINHDSFDCIHLKYCTLNSSGLINLS